MVGLAGGVGAGKSTVAAILAELGAAVIDSDALAHQELDTPDVKESLRRWWGDDVLKEDGSVNRRKVAAIVFSDPTQRHRLEALVHPRIAVRRADMVAELQSKPGVQMIVLDTPLLYETDMDLLCDAVIFIEAEQEARMDRTCAARAWSREELVRREKTHQPLDMKRARADYICRNHSSLPELREQVVEIFSQIVSKAEAF